MPNMLRTTIVLAGLALGMACKSTKNYSSDTKNIGMVSKTDDGSYLLDSLYYIEGDNLVHSKCLRNLTITGADGLEDSILEQNFKTINVTPGSFVLQRNCNKDKVIVSKEAVLAEIRKSALEDRETALLRIKAFEESLKVEQKRVAELDRQSQGLRAAQNEEPVPSTDEASGVNAVNVLDPATAIAKALEKNEAELAGAKKHVESIQTALAALSSIYPSDQKIVDEIAKILFQPDKIFVYVGTPGNYFDDQEIEKKLLETKSLSPDWNDAARQRYVTWFGAEFFRSFRYLKAKNWLAGHEQRLKSFSMIADINKFGAENQAETPKLRIRLVSPNKEDIPAQSSVILFYARNNYPAEHFQERSYTSMYCSEIFGPGWRPATYEDLNGAKKEIMKSSLRTLLSNQWIWAPPEDRIVTTEGRKEPAAVFGAGDETERVIQIADNDNFFSWSKFKFSWKPFTPNVQRLCVMDR